MIKHCGYLQSHKAYVRIRELNSVSECRRHEVTVFASGNSWSAFKTVIWEESAMEQIYNPYLPLTEYIPDGEPHVFGDRVYIYGSHDRAGGTMYCEGDYVVWSAPVKNLHDWRCEGVSFRKTQDPGNRDGSHMLYAPDCIQGPDGRFYLYYAPDGLNTIGVAVSDVPQGPFDYYGNVTLPPSAVPQGGFPDEEKEGKPATPKEWILRMEKRMNLFDPGVYAEDGRVWLYFGFTRSFGIELEPDMLTGKGELKEMIPTMSASKGTPFEGHAFFEASSMRKIGDLYYFIYSSERSHELCYATGPTPMGPFSYGGTIVSNGDIGIDGRIRPVTQFGNTHGSIEQIDGRYYVFYHRQTHGTEFSRQGCAEEIEIQPDGSIRQVPVTSCGLNGTGLVASGSYPAAIACHIANKSMPERINYQDGLMKELPHVVQCENQVFITGIRNRSRIGFKYFRFLDTDLIALELRGSFFGKVTAAFDETGKDVIGELEVQIDNSEWAMELIPVSVRPGQHPLFLYFRGDGNLDFKSLAFFST